MLKKTLLERYFARRSTRLPLQHLIHQNPSRPSRPSSSTTARATPGPSMGALASSCRLIGPTTTATIWVRISRQCTMVFVKGIHFRDVALFVSVHCCQISSLFAKSILSPSITACFSHAKMCTSLSLQPKAFLF